MAYDSNMAPMFAFKQQMEQDKQQRELFPIKKAQAIANVKNTQSATDVNRQNSLTSQAMRPLKVKEEKLNIQQKEAAWRDYQANEQTREALRKLNLSKAQFLQENTDKVLGLMSGQLELDKASMTTKQLQMKYDMQSRYAQEIADQLKSGNVAAANVAYENYVNNFQDTFGKPPSSVQTIPVGGINADMTNDIQTLANIARHTGDFLNERELQTQKENAQMDRTRAAASSSNKSNWGMDDEQEWNTRAKASYLYDLAPMTGVPLDSNGNPKPDDEEQQAAAQDMQTASNTLTGITNSLRNVVRNPQGMMSNYFKQNYNYDSISIPNTGVFSDTVKGFIPNGDKTKIEEQLGNKITQAEVEAGKKMTNEQKKSYVKRLLEARYQKDMVEYAQALVQKYSSNNQ